MGERLMPQNSPKTAGRPIFDAVGCLERKLLHGLKEFVVRPKPAEKKKRVGLESGTTIATADFLDSPPIL